ncbi:MAG: phenylalanine--tRNA ligase subunit alpha [Mycoplasmataceae bacterium]|nr:phenylalanine--tRNA ligase subunit alpha [Mycoplasmataceae bacterium]
MKTIDKDKLLFKLRDDLEASETEAKLIENKNIFTKKYLSPIYDELKLAATDQKKEIGNFANIFKKQITDIFDEALNKLKITNENKAHHPQYDININSSNISKGSLSPISLILNDILTFFKSLDFKIAMGKEVVDTKYNFDNLNIDINHPARSTHDSFFINANKMLRTHCTAETAKQLENNKNKDIRILSYGNVYRNDDDDATHSHQFNQIDFVWVKDGLNLKNLKWLISSLLKHLFGDDIKVRYRLSYFPFTEPSFEVDMSCINCQGKGCSMCKNTGWIEILGAGMLHHNVLKASNVSIKNGIAAGIGLDRLAILKYGLTDIRDIYSNDFRIMDQFKLKV